MRVMVMVKATPESEAGQLPTVELMTEMGAFNEKLIKAGIMLAGDGLMPSAQGRRVHFEGRRASVVDGPFAEAKELVGGYWIWEVASLEEATEWLKRAPFVDAVVELRRIGEAEDYVDAPTEAQLAADDR